MIGVIGGYGDIGKHSVKALLKRGIPVKIGGRHASLIQERDRQKGCLYEDVDITDETSILNFIKDCEGILNCAGPSCRYSFSLAEIVMKQDIIYIDAGYPGNWKKLNGIPHRQPVVFGAGSTPGLSGLLPRFMAKDFTKSTKLFYCYCAAGQFTLSAAEDYLEGLFDSDKKSMMVYENSEETAYHHLPKELLVLQEYIQYFYPYIDEESQFLIQQLHLTDGQWYMGVNGDTIHKVVESARYSYKQDKTKTIKTLCDASTVDLYNQKENVNFYIQLEGFKGEKYQVISMNLHTLDHSYLTGYTAATAMLLALEGKMEKDIILLGQTQYYEAFIRSFLENMEGVTAYEIAGTLQEMFQPVEGVL